MGLEFVQHSGVNTATGLVQVFENLFRIEIDGQIVGYHDRPHPVALIRPVSESERAAIDAMALAREGKPVKIQGPPPQPAPPDTDLETEDDEVFFDE